MTGKQRAALRKMANPLETIIYIGKEGVTEHVVKEVYDALEARELMYRPSRENPRIVIEG